MPDANIPPLCIEERPVPGFVQQTEPLNEGKPKDNLPQDVLPSALQGKRNTRTGGDCEGQDNGERNLILGSKTADKGRGW